MTLDNDMTEKTFDLVEYHDFLPEEQLLHTIERVEAEPVPFDMERVERDYIKHLPVEHDPEVIYPWRDRAWQGEWLWKTGGIGAQEAYFWFVAMTHPDRHDETQLSARVPGLITSSQAWFGRQWDAVDATWAARRIREWFEQERLVRAEARWFAYSYLTRLLVVLLPTEHVLEVLFDAIPTEQVRHFFVHLEESVPRSEALNAKIQAWCEQVDVTRSEQEAYAVVRLLERLPHRQAALMLCERVHDHQGRSATLARDAVNVLEGSEDFATWFNAFEDYHVAREMVPSIVLRGGFEVVPALMARLLDDDDALMGGAFKDLLRLRTWRAVEGFLKLAQRKKFSAAARDWLVSSGAHGVEGLVEVWLDPMHPNSRDALRFLDEMCARGHLELVERRARNEPDPARRARIERELVARYL